jgi:hypothetical protein
MTLTFYILDEGNHRSGPYASLAEAAQQLRTHWDHVHADEDGKFRPLTPAEQQALAKLLSVSADAQQEGSHDTPALIFRTSCDCLVHGGCPACSGDVRLGGKDSLSQEEQPSDQPDAATLSRTCVRFRKRF